MKKTTEELIEKIKVGEKNRDFTIIRHGIFNIQVCTKKNELEALAFVREFSPAGTENNWKISEDKNLKPVYCEKGDGSRHYVFCC